MSAEQSGPHKVRYAVFTWVPEELLASWNEWHNEVHVPEVLETPQMRAARKYRVADTTPNTVVLHDPSTVPVVQAVAESAGAELSADYLAMTSDPRSGELLPEHLAAQQVLNGGSR